MDACQEHFYFVFRYVKCEGGTDDKNHEQPCSGSSGAGTGVTGAIIGLEVLCHGGRSIQTSARSSLHLLWDLKAILLFCSWADVTNKMKVW